MPSPDGLGRRHLSFAEREDIAIALLDAGDDILAFTAFPVEHWPKPLGQAPGA